MAIRAMISNRMRTLLTMLGIIIGIMSVVTVVALARGASDQIIQISHPWALIPSPLCQVRNG